MKILLSSTYVYPYISGVTVYVDRLKKILIGKKYDVKNLTFENRSDYLFKISKGFVPSLQWLVRAVDMVKWSDRVVVNLPQFEGIIPLVLTRFLGKKSVCIFHCDLVLPGGIFNRIVEALTRVASWLCLLLCDEIVTYTNDYAENVFITRMFLGKTKCILPPVVKPGTDKLIEKMVRNLTDGFKYKIGFAGRIAHEKGLEYLIESVSGIEGSKLLVAGPLNPVGEEMYKSKIMNLAEKYKQKVAFTGEISPENMGAFYKNIDVLVLPSINRTESFGMVQVESMLWGVPVVASDLPGVRMPIKLTGMGEICEVGNVQLLTQTIIKVLENKDKYANIKKVLRLFGGDQIAISEIF